MIRSCCLFQCIVLGLLVWSVDISQAQHAWQKPSAPMKKADVEKIVGPLSKEPFATKRHIVWVWGYDGGHQPGSHDYTRVRDLMVGLLAKVPRVSVETAYLFPTKEQFEKADLVVFYLHLPGLGEAHYKLLDPYLARGGGVVAIHETMIQRPKARGEQWAERIGLAWSEGRSTWGALFAHVHVDNTHPIFARLPDRLEVVDEFYWKLTAAKDSAKPKTLGRVPVGPARSSRGPVKAERLSKELYPVFWTMEPGKGRVFCSLPGHNTFLFYEPRFRVILLRGMAWAMGVRPDPLMPLVFDGIEKNGHVGTTDTMRRWNKKPRNPQGEDFDRGTSAEAINDATNARLKLK